MIKQTWIEMEAISDPSMQCFPMFSQSKQLTRMVHRKEINPHTACIRTQMLRAVSSTQANKKTNFAVDLTWWAH